MKYLIEYSKEYKFHIILCLVLGTIWSFSLLLPPRLLADILDIGLVNDDINYMVQKALQMIGVTILNLVTFLVNIYLVVVISTGLTRNLRSAVFRKVMSFNKAEMDLFGTSTLVNRQTNDMIQIQNTIDFFLRKILTTLITIVGAVVMSFRIAGDLAGLMLMTLPLILVISIILINWSTRRQVFVRDSLDEINLRFRENISGGQIIRAFVKERLQKVRFDQANEEYFQNSIKAERISMALSPIIGLAMNLMIIAIFWLGARKVVVGTLGMGGLIAVIEYIGIILQNAVAFAIFISQLPRARVALVRIEEILDISQTRSCSIAEIEPGKDLEIKNLDFSYKDAQKPALSNVSFILSPGEFKGIIGSTGAGKSTLIKVILGLYPDQTDSIFYDKINIKSYENREEIFSYVGQDTILFSGTVADNLKVADQTASERSMWQVLDMADIGDYFRSKNGLDTKISQSASNLSGGQKQRLTIARGLLKEAQIYIFDDSFSALDVRTEARVRAKISDYLKNKSLLIVGQRVSTIRDADEILLMENGKILDRGSHGKLSQTSQVYKEILESQNQEEDISV